MSKKKNNSKDKRLLVAQNMPPLYRTQPGEDYSYRNDEVFEWISKRYGLINYIFDKLVASGLICYDSRTGKWQGSDCEDLCPHGDYWDDCPDCRHL